MTCKVSRNFCGNRAGLWLNQGSSQIFLTVNPEITSSSPKTMQLWDEGKVRIPRGKVRIPDTEKILCIFYTLELEGMFYIFKNIFSKIFFQLTSIGLKTSNDHLHSRVKVWDGSQLWGHRAECHLTPGETFPCNIFSQMPASLMFLPPWP